MSESEHRMIEILRILNQQEKPTGSKIIATELKNRGFNLGERAVRYHMKILDEKGLTKKVGYSGREITELGKSQLEKGLVYDEVDFTFSKFQDYIYQTDFNLKTCEGTVIVNTSNILEKNALDIIKKVFKANIAVSPLVGINTENINGREGYTIKTICGTTIDGIFLKNGIATKPKFGGIIEVKNYEPQRFEEIISYKKTSITPLDAFIAKNMTSVLDVVQEGNGSIPANFRIIPSKAKNKAIEVINKLKKSDICGIIAMGKDGEDILGVPVAEGSIGIAIAGGVTPFCAAQELDYEVDIRLGEDLADYSELKPICETKSVLKKINPNKKYNQIPFFLSKSMNLIQETDYNWQEDEGNIIVDISYINRNDLDKSLDIYEKAYKQNPKCVNPYYKIVEHEKDKDKVGIATVCSLSIDGILINNGIMTIPKYGGLLEINRPPLFVELISYNGTSIDPHKIFIFKNLTSINKKDNEVQRVLASIKEIPNIAKEESKQILTELQKKDLPIYKIGNPRELVYNAPVDNYNFGIVAGSGLNSISAIREKGVNIEVKALEGIMALNEMEKL